MEAIQIFSNPNFGQIRTISIDGDTYFAAIDVCNRLRYKSSSSAIRQHVDQEDKIKFKIPTNGGEQNLVFINESGVYSLIYGSELKDIKPIKRWIVSEVLCQIRKTEMFILESENQALRLEMQVAIAALEMNTDTISHLEERIIDLKQRIHLRAQEAFASEYPSILYSVTEIANSIGLTSYQLNKRLEEMGVQLYESGVWRLTERFYGFGYTRFVKSSHKNKHGEIVYDYITKWTEKGRKFIIKLMQNIDIE